ncbi:MAG: long-chain fatty acid--CoA ligase [Anaerolineae bacterium]|nr:long-chain fatty acid--CoA ligase [Anaerolineae bacterium]
MEANYPKPWVKFYEPGVPETVEIPTHTLHQSLTMAAEQYPNSTAIIFYDKKMTWRELDDAATRFAVALQNLGIKKGDRVMLYLPNTPHFVIAFYGTLRAGGIVVPTNPQYVPRELAYQATDSGSETIVSLTLFWKNIKEARPHTPIKRVILGNIKEYFPPLLKFLFTIAREKKEGHRPDVRGEEGVYDFQTLLRNSGTLRSVEVTQDDIAVLGYTGGTTGVSKGAMLTHRNLVAQAAITLAWFPGKSPGKDVFMGALPLFHSFGMTCVMNAATHIGAAMVLIPNPRDLTTVLRAAHKHRPTIFAGVPTMYAAINNRPDLHKYDLTSIKSCTSGAAPLPLEVQTTFERITGGKLVEGYGLTETCSPTHVNPLSGTRKIGTIGVPLPNTLSKIVDPETGKDLPVGEIGEIAIKSPQVMLGYWNKPEETARVMLEGGWFLTGDLGKMDEDGFFTVVDRKKDMFIVGGFNVYPREIEEVLYQHPKVLEAAVIGIPDIQRGENIKAFIVLKPGETATAEEIIEYCRANLTRYKVPREVEFRDALPKTLVGKILRRTLRDEEMAKRMAKT